MPTAGIDIGSNSLLLLVVGDDGTVLHDEARVVGLGTGLGPRGLLKADRMDVALATLDDYARTAREKGVEPGRVRVAATSAFRRALNAQTFAARILTATGLKVHVIAGDEEARITAAGAFAGLSLPRGPLLLVDPGGGSTEIAHVEVGQRDGLPPLLLDRASLEIGSVRITDAFFREEPVKPLALSQARAALQETLAALSPEPWPRAAVVVGGTATALASAALDQPTFDGPALHGSVLDLSALRGWVDRLRNADLEGRRLLLPTAPERAETILAGALILEQVLVWCRRPSFVVSSRGLRFGLVQPDLATWEGRTA